MDGFDVDSSRAAWWAVGALFGLAAAFVVYAFVGTFVFALFIYYATRPVYRRLRRRVPSPSLAAALSLLVLALPALLLLGYALAIGLQELARFSETVDLGPLEAAIGPYLDVAGEIRDPGAVLQDPNVLALLRESSEIAVRYLGLVATGLLHLFVMFALAFYLLRDGSRLSRWVRHRFGDDRGVLDQYLRAIDQDLHSIFSGNILNAIITGAIGAIVYNLLDFFAPATSSIPYPALIGLLAGAASLIPVIGMKLVYVPVAAYLFGREYLAAEPLFWVPAAFALVSFVVVDSIPDLVLRPYVSGRNLHVGMVMFAYILGPLLFGWYGIFLGPVFLVLGVHFARLVLPELVDGRPVRPIAVDPPNASLHPPTGPAGDRPDDTPPEDTAPED